MTTATLTVDHEIVHDSFRQWQAEQESLDAQLAESVAALDAYQSHLDAWQQELAGEREELQQLRDAIEHDQASSEDHSEQLDLLRKELHESREEVSSLASSLLEAQLQSRAAQPPEHDRKPNQQKQPGRRAKKSPAAEQSAPTDAPAKQEQRQEKSSKSPNAVLGSVIEQFGKLRRQRSAGRQKNSKPR